MKEIRIVDEINLLEGHAWVHSDSSGGTCVFNGTVRNQTKGKEVMHLEFEAYESMALKELDKIADEAFEKYDIQKILIHHVVGRKMVGETVVLIAVASAHRKAAFKACHYAIDRLKETVPIWKKETFNDGSHWVAAHP